MTTTHLLYLHGFRSSPQSTKARQTARWITAHRPGVRWCCPQLPPSPRAAMALIEDAVTGWPRDSMAVIGSSLGGWYATTVAERHGCRAVLLNPAVDPARDLARHLGTTTPWHGGDPFEFRPEYVDELRAIRVPAPTAPARYFVIVAKGDEVLDWREMAQRYAGCRIKLLEGGDHALSDYEAQHLPEVLRFLGLA